MSSSGNDIMNVYMGKPANGDTSARLRYTDKELENGAIKLREN
jgi:hypothetical protein